MESKDRNRVRCAGGVREEGNLNGTEVEGEQDMLGLLCNVGGRKLGGEAGRDRKAGVWVDK